MSFTLTLWDGRGRLFMVLPNHPARWTAQREAVEMLEMFPVSARSYSIVEVRPSS